MEWAARPEACVYSLLLRARERRVGTRRLPRPCPIAPPPVQGERVRESILHLGANLVDDFLIFRESACFELGEDQVAVDADFKAAAIGGDQLDGSEPLAEFIH